MSSQEPSALGALLARVEAADGPDRELDALLWAQLAEDRDVRWDGNTLLGRSRRPPHDECVLGYIDPGRVARNFQIGWSKPPCPLLTASLDAALSLVGRVLPGALWRVEKHTPMPEHALETTFWATCGPSGSQEQAFGYTAPIAIIAALLVALAASTAGPIGGPSHRLDEDKLPSTESEGR